MRKTPLPSQRKLVAKLPGLTPFRRRLVERFHAKYPVLLAYLRSRFRGLVLRARSNGHEDEDIEQQAWAGIVNAALLYEGSKLRGGNFGTFALWHVRGYVCRLAYMREGFVRPTDLKSLDYKITDDGFTLKDDEQLAVIDPEPSDFWGVALDALRPRERQVIQLRYRDEVTLEVAAKVLGVSRRRVRQIEVRALRRLREAFPHLAV